MVVVGEKVNLVIPFQVCSGAVPEPDQLHLDLYATSKAKARQTQGTSREEAGETSNTGN